MIQPSYIEMVDSDEALRSQLAVTAHCPRCDQTLSLAEFGISALGPMAATSTASPAFAKALATHVARFDSPKRGNEAASNRRNAGNAYANRCRAQSWNTSGSSNSQ